MSALSNNIFLVKIPTNKNILNSLFLTFAGYIYMNKYFGTIFLHQIL